MLRVSAAFFLVSFAFPRYKMIFSSVKKLFGGVTNSSQTRIETSSGFSSTFRTYGDRENRDHMMLHGGSPESRVIIVGDVHGCADEMEMLLEKCHYDEKKDIVIFVGDLVNKGPKSAETIRRVRAMTERGEAFCVMGNHDLATLRVYDGPTEDWKKKYSYLSSVSRDDMEWLRALPYTIAIPDMDNALVVHAGLVPGVSLEQQRRGDMTTMRNLVRDEERAGGWRAISKTSQGSGWVEEWRGPYKVYFGHDAKRGLQTSSSFAKGLDTGCCYGRQLTACILPGDIIVQVPAKAEYAPA